VLQSVNFSAAAITRWGLRLESKICGKILKDQREKTEEMVGRRRLELPTSTVSKFKYLVIQ
jgi:hypothetical protein